MKKLVFIVVLVAVGYFAYQYFLIPWLDDFAPAQSTTGENRPSIPDACRVKGKIVEDGIYDFKIGKISDVLLDQYTDRFQTCLKRAGFSDADIDGTFEKIKERAENRPEAFNS
ncbi:MAG: hypothetical protein KJO60_03465 [Desulfofustis sp.]|nr:hypothetical protein [Desulfofustis sp.]